MEDNFKIKKDGNLIGENNKKEVTIEDRVHSMFTSALEKITDQDGLYSNMFKDDSSGTTTLTASDVDNLSSSPQDDLDKVKKISTYVRQFINKNDLIGKAYDAIENNTNTAYNLYFKSFDNNRNKNKKMEEARSIIEQFNEQIDIKGLIRKVIPTVYAEGNYICYLKGDSKTRWTIDYYPLGIAEISDYAVNGYPAVLMNVDTLKQKLRPNSSTSDIFFKDVADIIKTNYPEEVQTAYSKNNKYALLDPMRTGVIRINNMMKSYGVSPILRAFMPLITLENYENADVLNSKAKAKKIIWQKMRKELFDNPDETDIMGKVAFAQSQLTQAWKNSTVIYSAPPWVEDVAYVEPTTQNTPIETLTYQRNKVFTALGITYLNEANASVTGGKISVAELMKSINKTSEQLERYLERCYRVVLIDNGFNEDDVSLYCPKINIIDSEQMEVDVKKDIATLLYSTLNCSLDTTLGLLGINAKDEYEKRKAENEKGYDEVFKARQTSFTSSGNDSNDDKAGRPADKDSNDPKKQEEDNARRND